MVVVTATPAETEETAVPEEDPEVEPVDDTGPTAILKQDLNVRRGPGTNYAVMTALPGGTTLAITGVDRSGYWWRVTLPNGQEGWVSASYTNSENTEEVPIVNAPATPSGGGDGGDDTTPTPTMAYTEEAGPTLTPSYTDVPDEDVAPPDSDITTDLDIKGGTINYSGDISYPSGDANDRIYVDVIGFDSITTAGDVVFTLTCSSSGNSPSVSYGGGSVTNGSPGCNSTWTVFFTNDSAPGVLTIKQESSGYTEWTFFGSGQE